MSEFEQSVAELPCVTVEAVMRLRERAILLERQLTAANERAEKLQASIDESQTPIAFIRMREDGLPKLTWNELAPFGYAETCTVKPEIPLYLHPIIPPDVEALQCRFDTAMAEKNLEINELRKIHGNGADDETVALIIKLREKNAELRKQLEESRVPEELFDGYSVFSSIPSERLYGLTAQGVSDVLDVVVRLIHKRIAAAPQPKEQP